MRACEPDVDLMIFDEPVRTFLIYTFANGLSFYARRPRWTHALTMQYSITSKKCHGRRRASESRQLSTLHIDYRRRAVQIKSP